MSELWFTRATLRTDAPDVAPLLGTLLGDGSDSEPLNTTHRLLWTLLAEADRLERDPTRAAFLWRQIAQKGTPPAWYVLGPRPRGDAAFLSVETKPWALSTARGDRFSFDMAVHATVNRAVHPDAARKDRRERVDVVLDAIHQHPRTTNAPLRRDLRQELGQAAMESWWQAQGERFGFDPEYLVMRDYRTVDVARKAGKGGRPRGSRVPQIGVARITGTLTVTDPAAFAAKVATGFGHAKAFGFGLLLLKRGTS